jgi:hypothetical protein
MSGRQAPGHQRRRRRWCLPIDYSQLLAAVQRACVGGHLDPHVVVLAVDIGNHVGGPGQSDMPISLCLFAFPGAELHCRLSGALLLLQQAVSQDDLDDRRDRVLASPVTLQLAGE